MLMKKMTLLCCFLALNISILTILLRASLSVQAAERSGSPVFLLYMMGCDLEEDSAAASDDLMEIRRITKEIPVTVIVYAGASRVWWTAGLTDGNCYDLEFSDGEMKILKDLGAVRSGESAQLSRFLNTWGRNDDDLVFWGHGFTAPAGIGYDLLYGSDLPNRNDPLYGIDTPDGNDLLTIEEICSVLDEIGLHFRLLGFDACQMASLDNALALHSYADYFAASMENESLSGWNYRIVLQTLQEFSEELPSAFTPETLQMARRNPEARPLTLLSNQELAEYADELAQVLKRSTVLPEIMTLERLCETSNDREAGNALLRWLNGQDLLVTDISACTRQIESHFSS